MLLQFESVFNGLEFHCKKQVTVPFACIGKYLNLFFNQLGSSERKSILERFSVSDIATEGIFVEIRLSMYELIVIYKRHLIYMHITNSCRRRFQGFILAAGGQDKPSVDLEMSRTLLCHSPLLKNRFKRAGGSPIDKTYCRQRSNLTKQFYRKDLPYLLGKLDSC